jgi:hypothetical protein
MSMSLTKNSARLKALRIAHEMLVGRISLIEGCRKLVSLGPEAEIPRSAAFLVITAVDSDTHDCPIGSIRAGFAPELLAQLDAKVSRILARDTPVILEACRDLIREIESLQLGSCEGTIQ